VYVVPCLFKDFTGPFALFNVFNMFIDVWRVPASILPL